jgi:hypothetical protein
LGPHFLSSLSKNVGADSAITKSQAGIQGESMFKHSLVAAAIIAAAVAPIWNQVQAGAVAAPEATSLALINGWKSSPLGTAKPTISLVKGIVHFKGAIWTKASNNNDVPFVVPAPFRPATLVYVKVDMCDASNGRVYIAPNGTATVQAEYDASKAKCLTSLDGATYAVSSDGFKTLNLRHGWQPYSGSTGIPAVRAAAGIVRFTGAMSNGSNESPFVMPAALRPSARVYVPIDTSGATNGRLVIYPDGSVTVQTEGDFSNAVGFTSLEGAWYARDTSGFTPLTLINSWVASEYGTVTPGIKVINGVVHFQGAIETGGNSNAPFVLPVGFRPSRNVFVPVDMCSSTNGRLDIAPDGSVTLEAENDFGNATCFTSLEGASFHL